MSRAWVIDLLSSVISAVIVGAVVLLAGGPLWASIGFGFVYYLLRPMRAQEAAKGASVTVVNNPPAISSGAHGVLRGDHPPTEHRHHIHTNDCWMPV